MNENGSLEFINEDGGTEEFYIIEETKINNLSYLLVTDSLDDEAEAYIMKDVSEEGSDEAVYEMVDDDEEIDYIGKIFSELIDDDGVGLE